MTDFAAAPVPEKPCKCVFMSYACPDAVRELEEKYNIRVISPEPIASISGEERGHADMSVRNLGDGCFAVIREHDRTASLLKDMGAKLFFADNITAASPRLNFCLLEGSVICDTRITPDDILCVFRSRGWEILHTNQRYAGCSCAVIAGNALITADPSISAVCRRNGIDILEIRPSHVSLDGYPYGFIGGACGMISSDILAFAGDLNSHPDAEAIRKFASIYGVRTVSLGGFPLYDVGGIVPVL